MLKQFHISKIKTSPLTTTTLCHPMTLVVFSGTCSLVLLYSSAVQPSLDVDFCSADWLEPTNPFSKQHKGRKKSAKQKFGIYWQAIMK